MNELPIMPIRAKYADETVKLEVGSVETLTTEQISRLKCGDIVIKDTGTERHAYVVSYKDDTKHEMSLVYADPKNIEEVYYEKNGTTWRIIKTITQVADKSDIPTLPTAPTWTFDESAYEYETNASIYVDGTLTSEGTITAQSSLVVEDELHANGEVFLKPDAEGIYLDNSSKTLSEVLGTKLYMHEITPINPNVDPSSDIQPVFPLSFISPTPQYSGQGLFVPILMGLFTDDDDSTIISAIDYDPGTHELIVSGPNGQYSAVCSSIQDVCDPL